MKLGVWSWISSFKWEGFFRFLSNYCEYTIFICFILLVFKQLVYVLLILCLAYTYIKLRILFWAEKPRFQKFSHNSKSLLPGRYNFHYFIFYIRLKSAHTKWNGENIFLSNVELEFKQLIKAYAIWLQKYVDIKIVILNFEFSNRSWWKNLCLKRGISKKLNISSFWETFYFIAFIMILKYQHFKWLKASSIECNCKRSNFMSTHWAFHCANILLSFFIEEYTLRGN